MTYGDSVVFHYNRKTGKLIHSFTQLADFSNPPRLISCKDPLEEAGFRSGEFELDNSSVVFVASDALSHYVLMMYELSKSEEFLEELSVARNAGTEDSQLLKTAETMRFNFCEDVLMPLQRATVDQKTFSDFVQGLYKRGVLGIDDYTVAFLKFDIEGVKARH